MGELADGIRRVRKLRGLGFVDAADAAGVSTITWGRFEAGTQRPTDEQLTNALGVTVAEAEAIGGDDPALREGM